MLGPCWSKVPFLLASSTFTNAKHSSMQVPLKVGSSRWIGVAPYINLATATPRECDTGAFYSLRFLNT